MTDAEKVQNALSIAKALGQVDGDHHKAWVIDQMVRALCGTAMADDEEAVLYDVTQKAYSGSPEYLEFVRRYEAGGAYIWDRGTAP